MKINSKNVIKLGLSVLVLAASITVTQVFATDTVGSISDRLGRFINIDIPQRDLAEKKRYINKNQNVQSRDEVTGLATADETNPVSSSSIELTPIDQLVGIEGKESTIFGESTDVDFRLYGQANLQRLQVLQDSAYDRLTVGYTDPRLAFGSPADLSVQGGIKIAALADASRTGLDRVCADDWGVLTVCDDASVTDPTSPVLTYSWNTVWGACGGSAGAETCTGNRYEPYKRMPLEFDQTPFREDQIDWSPGEYFDVTGGVEDGWVSLGFDLQRACTESNAFVEAPSTNTPHPDRKWTYFDGNTDSNGDCDPVVGTPYWGYLDSYDAQTAYEQWDIDRVAWRIAEDETPLSCNENNPATESQCLANNVFPADNCAWGVVGSGQSGSTQSATITCQDQNGNIVSDNLCTEPRPETTRGCPLVNQDALNPSSCLLYLGTDPLYQACAAQHNISCYAESNKACTADESRNQGCATVTYKTSENGQCIQGSCFPIDGTTDGSAAVNCR